MSHPTTRRLKAIFKQHGLRLTHQRKAILRIFREIPADTKLSAKDLFTRLHSSREYVSLSAIYQTLEVLVKIELLQESKSAQGCRMYALNSNHESHYLKCSHCEHKLDVSSDIIVEVGQEKSDLDGYQILDSHLILYVFCPQAWMYYRAQKLTKSWICQRSQQLPDRPARPEA